MIRFGYFHKDIKDEEKERGSARRQATKSCAKRQARNHAFLLGTAP
jgi:hypothetical protein